MEHDNLSKAAAQLALDTPTLEEQVKELREQLEVLREEVDQLKSDREYERMGRW